MRIFILDTETTGVDDPKVVEITVAEYVDGEQSLKVITERCNPKKDISIKAMSVHGITQEDVENSPMFKESRAYKLLMENNNEDNVVVIHNAKFDLGVLENEGYVNHMRVVDTLILARHMYKDDLEMEHNLPYLKYGLKLYKMTLPEGFARGMDAHSSEGDVATLFALFMYMGATWTVDEMIKKTSEKVIYNIMPIGKYKGEKISSLVYKDKRYLNWLMGSTENASLKDSIDHHLNGKE